MSVKSQSKSADGWKLRRSLDMYGEKGKADQAKTNTAFRDQCAEMGVDPTPRQYAKWANKTHRWRK